MDTLASLGGSKVISGPHNFLCSFHEKPKYLIIISDDTRILIYFWNLVSALPDMTYALLKLLQAEKSSESIQLEMGVVTLPYTIFLDQFLNLSFYFAWLYRTAKQNVTGSDSEEVKGRPCPVICRTVIVVTNEFLFLCKGGRRGVAVSKIFICQQFRRVIYTCWFSLVYHVIQLQSSSQICTGYFVHNKNNSEIQHYYVLLVKRSSRLYLWSMQTNYLLLICLLFFLSRPTLRCVCERFMALILKY